ncbi:MAG: hypothetical protein WC728_01830 [Elusimicrobiota bacterium]
MGSRARALLLLPLLSFAGSEQPQGFDYDAVLTLGPRELADAEVLDRVSRDVFEAYIAREVHPWLRFIPRRHFKRVQGWTLPFVHSHFRSLRLSFATEDLAGRTRFVQKTEADYNGHRVEFLKFRDGIHASTAIRIDGELVRGEGGASVRQWRSKDEAAFGRFVAWFEGLLGAP